MSKFALLELPAIVIESVRAFSSRATPVYHARANR